MNPMISLVVVCAVAVILIALVKTLLDIFICRVPRNSTTSTGSRGVVANAFPVTGKYSAWDQKLQQMERKMLELVNLERQRHPVESKSARPLVWHEGAAHVCRQFALDQAMRGYFGHYSPEGEDATARLVKAGVRFTAVAENVARGYPTIEATMAGFMDEPRFEANHRGAILSSQFTHAGVGVIPDPWGGLVIVQLFLR